MEMYTKNCDATAEIDFGFGTVKVRCTRMGKDHEEHRVEVYWLNRDREETK